MIGSKLGQYRILRTLGSGGMGTVLLGEHDLVGRLAAIKVLDLRLVGHPSIVDASSAALHASCQASGDQTRAALSHTRETLKASEQLARDLEAKLLDARTARDRAAVAEVPTDPTEVRGLKTKSGDLRAMIRERNREIAELRRQVDTQRDRPKAKP
ncbi:MAG TPA: hypothetical protein VHZ95_13670 [Polyangiales bacterium]|jgi:serine/threonine protein kinase|nr:hypothetical protein [Polyangiales bacterium]